VDGVFVVGLDDGLREGLDKVVGFLVEGTDDEGSNVGTKDGV
jgi:hypothetical protein